MWQERESLESLDSWHEDDGHFGGDSGGGLRDPVDIDVDPFTITDVSCQRESFVPALVFAWWLPREICAARTSCVYE